MVRRISILLWLLAAGVASAASTNTCVICGTKDLRDKVWISPRGLICNGCYELENRCSLCGLPAREGSGAIKTGDGRFICQFDKADTVLTAEAAERLFADARDDMVSLFGPSFALKFPAVTLNLFDVDYWSEKGRSDGLHKSGFSSTRKTPSGKCTHQVVLLSGRPNTELAATAAHEYTHLWINENLPAGRVIDPDTMEAICELAAYELMGARKQSAQQQRIRANSYTRGAIDRLLEVNRERGFRYVLEWVKTGEAANFESVTAAVVPPARMPMLSVSNVPPRLPESIKLSGLLADNSTRRAVISGVTFQVGETRLVKVRAGNVRVQCREIRRNEVVLEVDGHAGPVTLKMGEEIILP